MSFVIAFVLSIFWCTHFVEVITGVMCEFIPDEADEQQRKVHFACILLPCASYREEFQML
jgi:hypothetical protein